MMEKLSADEFDLNLKAVNDKLEKAIQKSGRRREDIILLAATKTVDVDTINYAINSGINYIGENKVQELTSKYEELPKDIRWHLIGHLQTNKVKYIVDKVHLIHSVDSVKLAKEIEKDLAELKNEIKVIEEDFSK